jgi:hypothetical protein
MTPPTRDNYKLSADNNNVMELLQYTQSRSPELAEYIRAVAHSPLSFDGPYPYDHSSHNHIHLWKLEYLADTCEWIDVDYRVECVNHILEQWRRRLKGLPPYNDRGYRLYVYEDLAPTISAVAETEIGFPFSNGQPVFVKNIRDVLSLYEDRSWKDHFASGDWQISEKRLLDVVTRNKGSISKPTAENLGVPVGKLRSLIINMGLSVEVNSVRKKFQRRPADFSNELVYSDRWRVFERLLPARYR